MCGKQEDGSKLRQSRLIEILQKISHLEMAEQKIIVEREFLNWKGSEKQIDDVLIIGFEISEFFFPSNPQEIK